MNEAELLRCGLLAGAAIVAGEPYEMALTDGLRRTVSADVATITVWHRGRAGLPEITVSGQETPPADELHTWTTEFRGHPYFANLVTTGDLSPYRTSDFLPFHRFRDTTVYRQLLAQYGLRHQLAATLVFSDRELVFMGLLRTLRDFSDREVAAIAAVRKTLSAALAYDAQVRAIQARIRRESPAERTRALTLTERETQVLQLVAAGYTNDQTAMRLGIGARTVRKHLESIFGKAHVSSRAAAVAWWLHRQ
ncbi:response regulator transcription factor [Labedaea rhizosphaerae]|uniref:Regulatory LuxR family protein n=1 Tax=Labedaea rhizosphaerae TaxID=598644 RepID=A0A4R6SEY6_LABRH|nr:helix-turn-helix transcriptional regulator [Labedaea rhizosphaerae]TDQ00522.1 regulatory LuxR family protein [Labedaea rhizosphaerae]